LAKQKSEELIAKPSLNEPQFNIQKTEKECYYTLNIHTFIHSG
jgi:hypothetical protein